MTAVPPRLTAAGAVVGAAAGGVLYRLETRDAIQARPAYWTPRLYACSTDGNVYAVNFAEQGTIGKVTPETILAPIHGPTWQYRYRAR